MHMHFLKHKLATATFDGCFVSRARAQHDTRRRAAHLLPAGCRELPRAAGQRAFARIGL